MFRLMTSLFALSLSATAVAATSSTLDEPDTVNEGSAVATNACADSDFAFIWRGFRHHWGYNHRLNRLGSWVRPGKCSSTDGSASYDSTAVHAAQSGSGRDTVEYKNLHSTVTSPVATFQTQRAFIDIDTSVHGGFTPAYEGQEIVVVKHMSIPAPAESESTVLLRGFDIESNRDADQILDMHIEIQNESWNASLQEFQYTIYAAFTFDCPTLECESSIELFGINSSPDGERVDYDLTVYTTVITADPWDMDVLTNSVYHSYSWDDYQCATGLCPENEVRRSSNRIGEHMTALPNYETAILGLKGFEVHLDSAHHMVEFDLGVIPEHYDPTTGRFDYDVLVHFQQWNAEGFDNMAEAYDPDPTWWWDLLTLGGILDPDDTWAIVKEHEGSADVNAYVRMVALKEGAVEHNVISGDFSWDPDTGAVDQEVTDISATPGVWQSSPGPFFP